MGKLDSLTLPVSSTVGNYWIRAELAPGRIWAFLEIWNADSPVLTGLPDVGK